MADKPLWFAPGPMGGLDVDDWIAMKRLLRHYSFVDYSTQAYGALVGLLILLFHNGTVSHWGCLVGIHLATLVAVHLLLSGHARRPDCRILDFLRCFYPVLLFTWFFSETGWINRMFFEHFLDIPVIRCEQWLFGCQPGIAFMQKVPILGLSELLYASYFSYYLMIAGVGIALFLRDRRQFFHYVSVVSFLFYICYLCYIVLPIIGPWVLFRDIPDFTLPADLSRLRLEEVYPAAVQVGPFFKLMAWIYRVFEAPGASLPSSHVAVALCTVYFSFKYLRRIRFIHLAAAILLCMATVYAHYHYVLDVLTGILTTLLVVPLANRLFAKIDGPGGPPAEAPWLK